MRAKAEPVSGKGGAVITEATAVAAPAVSIRISVSRAAPLSEIDEAERRSPGFGPLTLTAKA